MALAQAAGAVASATDHYRRFGHREIGEGHRRSALLPPTRPTPAVELILALLARASLACPRPWAFLQPQEAELVDGFADILFEDVYPAACPDVAAARAAGHLASGRVHWFASGRQDIASGQRPVNDPPAPACPATAPPAMHDLVEAVVDWGALIRCCASGIAITPFAMAAGHDLRGRLDSVRREGVCGWAWDPGRPGEPVTLSILVDGDVVGHVVANAYRADLEQHSIGDGRHAFEHAFEPPLSPLRHVVSLRREPGTHLLPGSPVALPGAQAFDSHAKAAITEALDADATEGELRKRISFLASEMERLLQRHADAAVSRTQRLAALPFRRRWIDPALSHTPVLAKQALMIDMDTPDLGRDAGSAALVSHALSLQRLGYAVAFASAGMSPDGAEALEALGIRCCHAPWFGSVEEVLSRQSHSFDVVYLHRVKTALSYLALVRRHMPRARVIYSVADLHHLRLARQATVEDRPELARQAGQIRGQELLVAAGADAVITHSGVEAEILRQSIPASRIHVVPWAIEAQPDPNPFARRSGIGFIGNYGHAPNTDAALWLLDEVMPLLWADAPGITCHLVGPAMPPVLRSARPDVQPHGRVADLPGFLKRLRLTVAPLQFGAGIKGKVLDSLAAGVPCVCTSIAVEGLALGPALRSLVADDPAGFATSVGRLYSDKRLYQACREEGLAFVAHDLAPARIDALLQAALAPAPVVALDRQTHHVSAA